MRRAVDETDGAGRRRRTVTAMLAAALGLAPMTPAAVRAGDDPQMPALPAITPAYLILGALADLKATDEATWPVPRNAADYSTRAVIRIERNDPDRALADLNEAIRLDPRGEAPRDFASPGWNYAARGRIWLEKGQLDRAIADYTEALRLDGEDADDLRYRGWAWYRKHDYDKALADLDASLRLDPESAHFEPGRKTRPPHPDPPPPPGIPHTSADFCATETPFPVII